MESNKVVSALAYFIFVIPLIADSKNEDYKFHANQGLVLLLFSIAGMIIGTIIPIIGWLIILPVGGILCLVLAIIGIVNVVNDRRKELPVIGKISLLK